MDDCPDRYLPELSSFIDLLALDDSLTKQLLRPVAEAEQVLTKALGAAEPQVSKSMSVFREQVRQIAGRKISKTDALQLEKLALEAEMAVGSGGLRRCVAGVPESAGSQWRP